MGEVEEASPGTQSPVLSGQSQRHVEHLASLGNQCGSGEQKIHSPGILVNKYSGNCFKIKVLDF